MRARWIAAFGAAAVAVMPLPTPGQPQACATSTAPALRFPSPQQGVSFIRAPVIGCGKTLDALLVRVSLREARLTLAVQTDPERGTRSVADYLRGPPQALAVVSGGFLQSYYPPLPAGYVRSGGRVVNRGRQTAILDGMICIGRGGKEVYIGRMSTERAAGYAECLQTGPLLITGSKPTGRFQDRGYPAGFVEPTRRALVASLPHDAVVIGIIENATLGDIADVAGRTAEQGGLGAIWAVNLSGSGTAGLAVAAGPVFGNVDVLLPNAIAARR